ncbi:MAG: efflux RND transporter permease subunit [Pirellulales bacterium]|nr:efflux RND transporter permease subunit [Pirellulales bacterium]
MNHPRFLWMLIIVFSMGIAVASWQSGKQRPHIPLQDLDIEDTSEEVDRFRLDRSEGFLVIRGDQLFTKSGVTTIRRIVEGLEKLPQIQDVFWIEDIPPLNIFGLSPGWLPEPNAEEKEYQISKSRILDHPLVRGQLAAPDGKTLLLPIRYNWIEVWEDDDCDIRIQEAAKELASDKSLNQFDINITGRVPLYLAAQRAFRSNHLKFQIIGYALVFIISIFLFRDIATIFVVGAAPAIAIFWTEGILKWAAIQSNDLTAVVLPVLITMVGLTDGVHLVVGVSERWQRKQDQKGAVWDALAHIGVACLLTSLTTAIGFLSLLFARSTPIRDFGLACSVAVLVTFIAVMTVIPAICLTPLGSHVIRKKIQVQLIHAEFLKNALRFVLAHYRAVSIAGALLTVICIVISLQLRPDARTINALPANSSAVSALKHCNATMGGIDFVRVVGDFSGMPAHQKRPVGVQKIITQIEEYLSQEILLQHPLSIKHFLRAIEREGGSRGLDAIELMPREIRNLFYDDKNGTFQIYVRAQDLGAAAYTPVFERTAAILKDLEKKHRGLRLEMIGIPVSSARDVSLIVYDLVASLGTASLVILLVMVCFYRSWRIGIVTLIPNLLPLALTGTLLVVTGQNLAIVSVCALAVCIGIAVDDSIHFLTRFRQELERGLEIEEAIETTFFGVGGALIITTVVLISGFATVLISPLPTHRMFSMMACATIGGALIGDLLFLPALLKWMIRRPTDLLCRETVKRKKD